MAVNYNISCPIYSEIQKDNYNQYNFKDQVLKYYTVNPCPLCHTYHPSKFYIFVKRTYRINPFETTTISVVRLICETAFLASKKNGRKIQYTITVLPHFLVPHSILPVENIFESINAYLSYGISMEKAAFLMFCVNVLTFRLHFSRTMERISLWSLEIAQAIVLLEGEIQRADIKCLTGILGALKSNWVTFKKFVIQHISLLSAISGLIILMENYFSFNHCWLQGRNMGLGP